MKTILIFEPLSGGHRANFIRWLEECIAQNHHVGCQFVFLTDSNVDEFCPGSKTALANAGRLKKRKILYGLFKQACKHFDPDHVLILELTHLELSLALHGAPCPVSAILFVQYPELPRGLKFFFKHWKTRRLLYRAPIKNIFLLNGEKSCEWLNERFGSRVRFIPVPDPVSQAIPEPDYSIRDSCGINLDRKIFLFFGAISLRKGAGVLLKALQLLPLDVAAKSAFIFCGEPEHGYRKIFERSCARLRMARPDIHLNIESQFVSDGRMMALFEQSDIILMPYIRPEYSSGILALAAKVRTPVIGPAAGLLGRLIQQNGLGAVCLIRPEAVAKSIADAIQCLPAVDAALCSAFVQRSRPEVFASVILDAIRGNV